MGPLDRPRDQLYLRDRCYAGARCNQAHIQRAWMQRVGDTLTAMKDAGCCHRHGDPVGDVQRKGRPRPGEPICVQFGDDLVTLDADRIAYTRY